MADSPFEIVTSSKPKRGGKGVVIAVVIVIFLLLSVVAGVLLVRQQQNVQEKASGGLPTPNLQNDPDNCGAVGNVCLVGDICVAGVCVSGATPSPTPIFLLSTPTASSSALPTFTPLPTLDTSTISAQTTPLPIPETGTGWPTIVGGGIGIIVIIASILLAL